MRTLAAVLLVAACSGAQPNKLSPDASLPVQADAPVIQPDAPPHNSPDAAVVPDASIDAPPPSCLIAAQLGTVAPMAPTVSEDADPPTFMEYDDSLNADTVPDGMSIQLFNGYGAFATAPIGPTTIDLTGAETGFDTCGGCVMLYGDVDPSAGPTTTYMPTSGTLTITSVEGNFTGTLTNATLVHVDIDSSTLATTPNPDGCATTVDSLSFDIAIQPPAAAFTAKGGTRLHKALRPRR